MCLRLYSVYLFVLATRLAWLCRFSVRENIFSAALAAMMLIHARWAWLGATSRSRAFYNVSILGRFLAAGLYFVVPLVFPSRVGRAGGAAWDEFPNMSRGWGAMEVVIVAFQLYFSGRRDVGAARPPPQRNWNRVLFGVWLVLCGTWMVAHAASFCSFFGLPDPGTVMFASQANGPAIDVGISAVWTGMTGDSFAISPFYMLSCFTRLLGLYNIVAGFYGVPELIAAGQQGGALFTILVAVLVVRFNLSWRVLLLPAFDGLSIVAHGSIKIGRR